MTVRDGKVQARPIGWKNMSFGAGDMAMLLMITMLAILNREFKFGLDDRLAKLRRETDEHVSRHMAAVAKAVDQSKRLSP